jgi:signal transduction histidine kinase
VNLLSNAIKYSDPDKTERYVEIAGEKPGDGWLHVTVRDNGVGIPATALAGIFERFTRAHAGDAEMAHVSGIGLGLSIVEDCIRAMGGHIQVQSVETEGTIFTVRLPTEQA